mgnify:FL=1
MIEINNLFVSLQEKLILKDVSARINRGDYFGLIGPNGSGKTTLLKTILQLQAKEAGSIEIFGRRLASYSDKEIAQVISYVPQDTTVHFDFKVRDIVAMGRYAHRSFFNRQKRDDDAIIKEAMLRTNTWHFRERSILSLSGGQRQLVFIAKALAQDTPIILLDEPISALDIYYQMNILKLLKSLSNQGKTVVIVLHDLNLAARFCNRLLLLKNGEVEAYGDSEEVLTTKILQDVYQVKAKIRKDEVTQSLYVTPL